MRVDLTKEVEALRVLRLRRDLTYERLAQQLGLKRSALYRLMTARPAANDRTAYRVHAFLRGKGRAA